MSYIFSTYEKYMQWKEQEQKRYAETARRGKRCDVCGAELCYNLVSMMIPVRIGKYSTCDSLTVLEPQPHICNAKPLNKEGEE